MNKPLEPLPPFQHGAYLHYKGQIYVTICLARRESDLEPVVAYMGGESGYIWVRPLSEWSEEVEPGKPRFEFVGVG